MDFGPLVTAEPWTTKTSTSRAYAYSLADRINEFWSYRGREAGARVEIETIHGDGGHFLHDEEGRRWVVRSDMVNGIAPRGARG